MPDVDLGPITSHQARITRAALGIAMASGELHLRENYMAARQVHDMLGLRLAQAQCPQRDETDALTDDEGDHVYAMAAWDAVNKRWIEA